MLLESTGKRSGKPRRAVLEVVYFDPSERAYYVAAGFGPTTHWYRNVLCHPEVQLQIQGKRRRAYARRVDPVRAGEILAGYAAQHPRMARALMRWLGFEVDGSAADFREVASSLGLNIIAFVEADSA